MYGVLHRRAFEQLVPSCLAVVLGGVIKPFDWRPPGAAVHPYPSPILALGVCFSFDQDINQLPHGPTAMSRAIQNPYLLHHMGFIP